MKCDARDWFVMILFAAIWAAGTFYIFACLKVEHHSDHELFAMWCGLVATMGGVYHWLVMYDSKHPDADRKDDGPH